MENKHSKGEWLVRSDAPYSTNGFKVFTGLHEDNKTIAHLPYGNTVPHYRDAGDIENEANAKLMAAAPNLLEACQMVIQSKRGEHLSADTVMKLYQAIEKATK